MDLSHLKVLVTGGAGIGVGFGACEALKKHGATLIINDIDQGKIDKAVATHNADAGILTDLTDPESVSKMFEEIAVKFGVINGLVNNAGVGLVKAVHEITEEEYDRVYNVNVKGMWRMTKYFVKQLLDNGETGNIVNISSVHASGTQPNYSTYASTKSAVEGFTRAIAYELGSKNIRCNAIAPGLVHAEQNLDLIRQWTSDPQQWLDDYRDNQQALNRFIDPIDCGHTISFLLSDLSKSITGQTINVDAGQTIMRFNKDYITE